MLPMHLDKLRKYLSSVYEAEIDLHSVGELNKKKGKSRELKRFGYGIPYAIEFSIGGEKKSVVIETMRRSGFGHDHFSDRAQTLLLQHSAFNKLPGHVHSVDVGAFTRDGNLKSVGDCTEFFIVTEKKKGELYHKDLDRLRDQKCLTSLDEERCAFLARYIAAIHKMKKNKPSLYIRRLRELVGHGEGIMGLTDSYPPHLEYITEEALCEIEKKCVEWRWRLKRRTHRCSQIHGDYHPWNILFREGLDFTVLDRSRGEWGEPADDVSAMSINFLFYSLQTYGKLAGVFEKLWCLFWDVYFNATGDEEIFTVIQPFYVWRALVIASPIWYPGLSLDVRVKLFKFIKKLHEIDRFNLNEVNSYFM